MKNYLSALGILILLTLGCGHRQDQAGSEAGRDSQTGGGSDNRKMVWETAWVDPRIVLSDTAITIFRAGRVDSVRVDAAKAALISTTSLEFQITNPTCPIEISLEDSRNQELRTLLSHTLETGFYKVSVNPGIARRLGIIPGRYKLKVVSCGRSVTKSVSIS